MHATVRGGLICTCIKYSTFFLHIGQLFSSGRGSFLALSAAGDEGARVYSRRKLGPRPGSVARALGIQSRAKWQLITGSLSSEAEPHKASSQDGGNPTSQLFCTNEPHGNNARFKVSPSCSHGHWYAYVDHYYVCVDIVDACESVPACAGLCFCVLVLGSPSFRTVRFLCAGIDTYRCVSIF